MKKLSRLVGAICLLASSVGLGAVSESRASFGVQGGASVSSASVSSYSSTASLTGFTAGVLLEAPLVTRFLFVQPELNFTQRGVENTSFAGAGITRLNYVEVPIYLKMRFDLGAVRPHILAGPRVGYLIGTSSPSGGLTTGDFNRIDLGVDAGAGLGFAFSENTQMFLTAKYGFGLTKINSPNDWTSRGILLTAGLLF